LRGRLKAGEDVDASGCWCEVTVMAPFVTVIELFRLKSMPRPVLPFAARVMGNGVAET